MIQNPTSPWPTPGKEVAYQILDDPVTVTDATTPTITKHNTPFNGEHVEESTTNATPIISVSGLVYVSAPVTRSTVQQKRVCSLNTSTWATVEDAQIRAVSHDANIGHRGTAVAASGTRIITGAAYNQAWGEKTSSTNLASLAATTDPTGSQQVSYVQYSVNPANGDIYAVLRVGTASPRSTRLYKWGGSTWSLVTILGETGSYTSRLAFTSAGAMYAAVGFTQPDSDSGYPRVMGSVVKSSDSGASWQTVDGRTAFIPLSKVTPGTPVMPEGSFNILRIAVDGDDLPVVLASFRPTGATYGQLWQATWDGEKFVHRLVATNVLTSTGDIDVTYHEGRILVTFAEFDIVDDPNNGPQSPYDTGKLWLLVSDDGAQSWTRYELHNKDVTNGYCGAYLDPTSLAVDGVVRLLPMDLVTPSAHRVWQLTLP